MPLDAAAPVPMYVVIIWQAGTVSPGAHAVHALMPIAEVNMPKAQAVHTDEVIAESTLLYAPTAHAVQTREVVAAVTLPYAPAGHAVQATEVAAKTASLYAPAAQAVQAEDDNGSVE